MLCLCTSRSVVYIYIKNFKKLAFPMAAAVAYFYSLLRYRLICFCCLFLLTFILSVIIILTNHRYSYSVLTDHHRWWWIILCSDTFVFCICHFHYMRKFFYDKYSERTAEYDIVLLNIIFWNPFKFLFWFFSAFLVKSVQSLNVTRFWL